MRLAFGLLAVSLAFAQLPKERIKEELKKFGHGEGRLKAGDPAADFTLKRLHSEQTVRLSSFQGVKPVALVFGSYT